MKDMLMKIYNTVILYFSDKKEYIPAVVLVVVATIIFLVVMFSC
jgi:hypothetical protein